MTAELGIFNKSCAVLAADSAVSYRAGDGLIPRNTATKIFALSDFHPVGIMVFGSPNYQGIPIELVIKGFRRAMRGRALPRLKDYQRAFVEHLETYVAHGESEGKWWMQIMAHVLALVHDTSKFAEDEDGAGRLVEALDVLEAEWAVEADLEGLQAFKAEDYFEGLCLAAGQALDHFFPEVPENALELQEALARVAYLAICKPKFFNPTGLVIAGYGDQELFPGCISFYLEGQCLGKPRTSRCDVFHVTHEQPSNVIPFAQGDVSMTVLRGIDPRFLAMVVDAVTRMMEDYNAQIVAASEESVAPALSEALREIGQEAISKLTSEIYSYQAEQHVGPTLGAIDLLSKEDLIEVAEALISLTTIKKRVSQKPEDVGGPVDIAVITKEDGFVWIKRKRYFSPELNPEYNARISSTYHG